MHEPPHDERIRRLQRIAYGAVASDAERAAAVAELESLRRELGPEADAPAAPQVAGPERAQAADDLAGVSPGVVGGQVRDDAARPLKWAIAAGTVALLVGVAVGWQAGTRLHAEQPATPDPALGASVSLSVGSILTAPVTVADSAAYAVFERPATPEDMPPIELPDEWRASANPRLLATMPDGMTVYAAKPPGPAEDLCMLVVVPEQPGFGISCTEDGVFEAGVLSYELWPDRDGSVVATVHADGSVQVWARPIVVPTP